MTFHPFWHFIASVPVNCNWKRAFKPFSLCLLQKKESKFGPTQMGINNQFSFFMARGFCKRCDLFLFVCYKGADVSGSDGVIDQKREQACLRTHVKEREKSIVFVSWLIRFSQCSAVCAESGCLFITRAHHCSDKDRSPASSPAPQRWCVRITLMRSWFHFWPTKTPFTI